jgi:hypothetical protein
MMLAWVIKTFYAIVRSILGPDYCPSYLKEVLTPKYFTSSLREKGLLDSDNEVTKVEWKSIQCGAIGSVFRITFHYKHRPREDDGTVSRDRKLYGRYPSSVAPATAIVKCSGDKLNQVDCSISTLRVSLLILTCHADPLCQYSWRHRVGIQPRVVAAVSCAGPAAYNIWYLIRTTSPYVSSLLLVYRLWVPYRGATLLCHGGLRLSSTCRKYRIIRRLCLNVSCVFVIHQESSAVGASVSDAVMMVESVATLHVQTWNNSTLFDQFR